MKKVGIVGYGALGQYLTKEILTNKDVSEKFQLHFVWNRTIDKILKDDFIPQELILHDLNMFPKDNPPDIVVEVAHPLITKEFGPLFLQYSDYFIGSPTALANEEIETLLRSCANNENGHGLYIPVGALWGAEDIQKMSKRGRLKGLSITMKFHPDSLKLKGNLLEKLESVKDLDGENILYHGPVREVCFDAPLNTNTMACVALAGLGFEKTISTLICDNSLKFHVIEIMVEGPETEGIGKFTVHTIRSNPALPGSVTGAQTYISFLNSLLNTGGKGNGFHFC